MKIGEENMIAVAPASGIRLKATSSIDCEATCEQARIACAREPRACGRPRSPTVGRMKRATVISATAVRVNSTSPIG